MLHPGWIRVALQAFLACAALLVITGFILLHGSSSDPAPTEVTVALAAAWSRATPFTAVQLWSPWTLGTLDFESLSC